jgi:hypothetical protein
MIQRYDINEINNQNENWQWCKSSDVEVLEKECEGKQFIIDCSNRINKESLLKLYILKEQNAEMLEALKYFVKRVDEGSIRSKKTYVMYKSIIEKVEDTTMENIKAIENDPNMPEELKRVLKDLRDHLKK